MVSNISNEIKVGGTLERVTRCSDGHVFDQQKHNTIVDQGMRMMLKVPESNTDWYTKSILTYSSLSTPGNIFKGYFRANTDSSYKGMMAHTGIAMFMACGSSDAATTGEMTQLTSFESDPTDGMSYGSTYGGYFRWNQEVSDSKLVFTAQYRYKYVAQTDFTCKEFGTYTMLLTSTPTDTSSILAWSSYTPKLFSRVVLTEPIEMTAGESYTFDYTLRFTISYTNSYSTIDDIFGLSAVKKESSWNLYTNSSYKTEANVSKFASDTNHLLVFASESSLRSPCVNDTGVAAIHYLSNGAGYSVRDGFNVNGVDNFWGMQFAPIFCWNTSAVLGVTSDAISVPTNYYNSNFNVTKSMPSKRQPDEVGDFYSVMTYTFTIPYSNTAGRYLAIWTPMYWYVVNATLSDTGTLTWNPYPRNNLYEYTLTCKTVLTREEA